MNIWDMHSVMLIQVLYQETHLSTIQIQLIYKKHLYYYQRTMRSINQFNIIFNQSISNLVETSLDVFIIMSDGDLFEHISTIFHIIMFIYIEYFLMLIMVMYCIQQMKLIAHAKLYEDFHLLFNVCIQ
jgi:hypothetical protein